MSWLVRQRSDIGKDDIGSLDQDLPRDAYHTGTAATKWRDLFVPLILSFLFMSIFFVYNDVLNQLQFIFIFDSLDRHSTALDLNG